MFAFLSRHLRVAALCAPAVLGAGAPRLHAQRIPVAPLVTLGSEAEQRLRLDALRGATPLRAALFRSASSMSPAVRGDGRFAFAFIAPELRVVTNSGLAFSLNQGPLWAGRGTNTMVMAGIAARAGPVRVIVAPQWVASENRAFQVIPFPQGDSSQRNAWANPFHPAPSSIDLPMRFGDASLREIDPGQSSITVDLPGAAAGVATENVWWGPGIRNSIILSNNAPGFPHAFVRTRDGVRTRFGTFDAQWILGRIDESDFFDANARNDARSLSGLLVAWTPRGDSGLTLGVARTVQRSLTGRAVPFGAILDVFGDVGNPNTHAEDTAAYGRRDQVFSFFGRWAFPQAGFEAFAEWSRFEQPRSLRDALEFPGHSQGYTLGLQWSRPARGGTLVLQAEGTYLEPDPSFRVRPVATTYTSRAVLQGYTHRGRSLGASIGPGSSGQWLAVDYVRPAFLAGVFTGRIRWDNATLWDPIVPQVKNEDVTLFGGVRGSAAYRGVRFELSYTDALRIDYLFQDRVENLETGTHTGVDIRNRTITLGVSLAPRSTR